MVSLSDMGSTRRLGQVSQHQESGEQVVPAHEPASRGGLGAGGGERTMVCWSAHYGSAGTALSGLPCRPEELITAVSLQASEARGALLRLEMGAGEGRQINLNQGHLSLSAPPLHLHRP
ncbi:hypothetical protein AAFF_G00054240 [Aldrovandia affinis]|uniref:Uncharacterized protein n=1 Tax=Aldrovandia affinis TaxID=143900 RepID=A0AAD7WEX7_9TELE|nr:hypothetical protein AAFF_G00054240 [Aldrovandia affinis]